MRRSIPAVLFVFGLAGCGGGEAQKSRKVTAASVPTSAVVRTASAQLSVITHHGVDSLSGVRVTGTCGGPGVTIEVGHAPPYQPLRKVRDPRIDRTEPPRRAALQAECKQGRFEIKRRAVGVRVGAGPLRARPRSPDGAAVVVKIQTIGIE